MNNKIIYNGIERDLISDLQEIFIFRKKVKSLYGIFQKISLNYDQQ